MSKTYLVTATDLYGTSTTSEYVADSKAEARKFWNEEHPASFRKATGSKITEIQIAN